MGGKMSDKMTPDEMFIALKYLKMGCRAGFNYAALDIRPAPFVYPDETAKALYDEGWKLGQELGTRISDIHDGKDY